jgi:hypothetical protein
MNWNLVKETCPKAWRELSTWCVIEFNDEALYIDTAGQLCFSETDNLFLDRTLFDFFDSKGLFVSVSFYQGNWRDRPKERNRFHFAIEKAHEETMHGSGVTDTRPEAEHAAFQKAYEILEQQLCLKVHQAKA